MKFIEKWGQSNYEFNKDLLFIDFKLKSRGVQKNQPPDPLDRNRPKLVGFRRGWVGGWKTYVVPIGSRVIGLVERVGFLTKNTRPPL